MHLGGPVLVVCEGTIPVGYGASCSFQCCWSPSGTLILRRSTDVGTVTSGQLITLSIYVVFIA